MYSPKICPLESKSEAMDQSISLNQVYTLGINLKKLRIMKKQNICNKKLGLNHRLRQLACTAGISWVEECDLIWLRNEIYSIFNKKITTRLHEAMICNLSVRESVFSRGTRLYYRPCPFVCFIKFSLWPGFKAMRLIEALNPVALLQLPTLPLKLPLMHSLEHSRKVDFSNQKMNGKCRLCCGVVQL